LQIAVKTASHANNAASAHHGAIGGPRRGKTSGGTTARAVVVNVTVAVAGFDPSSVTGDGETEHVAAAGVPIQLQVTAWSNPCAGVAETVKFACCPALIVLLAGEGETL
jgi:hypothetical protein